MQQYEVREATLTHGRGFKVLAVTLIAAVIWLTGAPMFLNSAKAATLLLVSDTLTDSDLGVTSGHTINFTIQTGLNDFGGSDKIQVDLDPYTADFNITDLDFADFVGETGLTVVNSCTVAASEVTLATTSEGFSLTVCTGDTIATSTAISLPIASSTSAIINPSTAQSYVIRITTTNQGNTTLDTGDTRIAIIDDVVVTASVDTAFTFTVTGLPSGTAINGVTTSTSTTATAIAFGVLDPTTNASTTAGQRLTVSTNAINGFTVTVREDQNLTSSTGADIDVFKDGNGQATPVVWTYPANTFGNENTYGHFGLTSSDDINASEFAGSKFVGNFSSTSRAVFHHNGPADGVTANMGVADVAYRIAITALQEAGTDYTNTLTYVATPTF